MHVSKFLPFADDFANQCLQVLDEKTAQYATDGDHFSHIEETAEQAGAHPLVVWKIFFQKHYLALGKCLDYYDESIPLTGDIDAADVEDVNGEIEHRIMDMINYLLMLAAAFPTQEAWDKVEANREMADKIQGDR